MYITVHKPARYPVLIFIAGAAEFNIGHLPARFHFCPCAQPKDLLRPVSFKRYCWCHKVWYHVTMMIVSMMVWFLILLRRRTESGTSNYLYSLSLVAFPLWLICFCVIHYLRFLRHSFTSYRYCSIFGERGQRRRALKYNPTNPNVVLCSSFLP
jgi:hypothetical protein